MKHMLANIQNHPMIPIAVLVLFVILFASMLVMVFRKDAEKLYEDASQLPLDKKGAHNE